MFDGRHCTQKDYALLVDETDKIIQSISNGYFDIDNYIKFIGRFDVDVADTLRYKVSNKDLSPSEMIKTINKYIDELKQQVLVDIREHN